jgi:DNA-binding response OmpR family regulator
VGAAQLMVVEDDPEIGSELVQALVSYGYTAALAKSGAAAEAEAETRDHDLILLDLGLPDVDGVVLCRRLRAMLPAAVIVVLTARSQELDVVVALDAGADDYLTKPFRLTELLARVRAHLRRQEVFTAVKDIRVGAVRIDVQARRVWVGDEELALRPKEFDLLVVLAGRAGAVVTREDLMSEVWDENWFGPTKTLDVHVSALRRKLTDAGEDIRRISTLRGRGYRYELEI